MNTQRTCIVCIGTYYVEKAKSSLVREIAIILLAYI